MYGLSMTTYRVFAIWMTVAVLTFHLWDSEFAPERGVAESLTRTRLVI
jgi:hypothetical protein